MVNKMILQGRLVRDVELKYTQSQVANCEFSVAWSEKYKEAETKCFLRCKAWRGVAEFVSKYFFKGQEIVIDGHLVTEEWDKDGEKKSRTICVVEKASFCGPKSGNGSAGRPTEVQMQDHGDAGFVNIPDDVEDESLPFN